MTFGRLFVIVPLLFASLATAATTTASGSTATPSPGSNNSGNTLNVEAIQAHFKNAQLEPELLSVFRPEAYLGLSFEGVGGIQPGQRLEQNQVGNTPTVTVAAANSSVNLPGNANYTLIMVDAGPVGTDENNGQTRHWLLNGVTLSGSSSNETVSNSTATAITSYAGPAPPSGSGPHRYVVLLYTQPSNFVSPSDATPNMGVGTMNLTTYVQQANLTGPIAGNYFQVEVGTATASISPTSAIVTSTLPVPSGASATASASGTNKPGTSTPKTSGSIAAHQAMELGLGALSLVFFASMAFMFVA